MPCGSRAGPVAAFAAFVTILFLCAAAFVFVFQNYGLIEACLSGAAIFLLITLIAVVTYEFDERPLRNERPSTAKSRRRTFSPIRWSWRRDFSWYAQSASRS